MGHNSWVWALIFGLAIAWGFEIRIRDLNARFGDTDQAINSLKDEIARLKQDIKRQVKYL